MQPSNDRIAGSTRTGRIYTVLGAGFVALLLVLIFVSQNGRKVKVSFLGWHGHMALGLALLFAAVFGGLVVVFFGAARILQLRYRARRHVAGHERAPAKSA